MSSCGENEMDEMGLGLAEPYSQNVKSTSSQYWTPTRQTSFFFHLTSLFWADGVPVGWGEVDYVFISLMLGALTLSEVMHNLSVWL